MALKKYKPNTPAMRGLVLVDRSQLWNGRPVKSLTEGLIKSGGRNNKGRVTSRRRGGGHKRLYRVIDFKRAKFDVPATVQRIEYDPNRSAFIALLKYDDGEEAYILAPQRLQEGDTVIAAFAINDICGLSPLESSIISNLAAGRVCEEIGVCPINIDSLKDIFSHHYNKDE